MRRGRPFHHMASQNRDRLCNVGSIPWEARGLSSNLGEKRHAGTSSCACGLVAGRADIGIADCRGPGGRRRIHEAAKAYIAEASAPVTTWDGPTTGPKAQGKKLVIYVSADQKNGGASGVGDGAQEAAKAIGWDFRILDGQGSVPSALSAFNRRSH